MQSILGFIAEYSYIFSPLLSLLVAFLLFFDKKKFKEVINLIKYRTENYLDSEPRKAQTFENLKPIKRLNKSTGLLEETGEFIDIDELVKSSLSTTLDRILDRFLPAQDAEDELVAERNALADDIDVLQDSFTLAEEYKQRYSLDENMSTHDVFKKLNEMYADMSAKIAESQNIIKNIDKEVNESESKKDAPKADQESK